MCTSATGPADGDVVEPIKVYFAPMRWLVLMLLFLATTINYLIPQLGCVPVVLTKRMFYLVAWFAVHKLMGNLEPVTIQAAAAGAGALRSVASRSPAATPIR